MRRTLAVAIALACLSGVVVASTTSAIGASARPLKCKTETHLGKTFRICTGFVLSKHGDVKLDTRVTLPPRGRGPFPLVAMLHGLGGNRTNFDCIVGCTSIEGSGSKYKTNNLWLASRGYAVLNYTARGHRGVNFAGVPQCMSNRLAADYDEILYASPPNAASHSCLPQIPHIKHEVVDAQWLISRLVDGTLLSADVRIPARRVGVGGVSYGGGTTWMLTRMNTWRTPRGKLVKLAAAVPVIGWTDLVEALLPAGRARDDVMPPTDVDLREAQRTGVLKESYVNGFYLTLLNQSHLDLIGYQLPGYLNKWIQVAREGEPYDNPATVAVMKDAIHKMLVNRSAFYVPRSRPLHVTPTFAVQGWTDEVFPAVHSLNMYNRQQVPRFGSGLDPLPMRFYFGDWGHPRSQSKGAEFQFIAARINQWLDHYLRGRGPEPEPLMEARTVRCSARHSNGADPGALYESNRWGQFQQGSIDENLTMGSGTLTTPADDPHEAILDPVFGVDPSGQCRSTDTDVDDENSAGTFDVTEAFTMFGMPEIRLIADPGAENMYISARLWDVDPSAPDGDPAGQTLVDRGVYRLGSDNQQLVVFQMNGTAYEFQAGHEIKLELTADDSPSFRRWGPEADLTATNITISNVSISIPTANGAKLVP